MSGTGTTVLASDYSTWWTKLNYVRGRLALSTVSSPSISSGTKATASDINTLINNVNTLRSNFSAADWTNYTESTKSAGQLIQWPGRMDYMLTYLFNFACANYSTNSNYGDFGNDGFYGANSTNSTNSTNGANSTFGNDGNFRDFSNDGVSSNSTEGGGTSSASGFCYNVGYST